jgi:3-hydroxybutyrate dehydrogenase
MAGMVEGRVLFITGAGSGIGRQIAMDFAREGARVALCDLNADAARQAAEELAAAGFEAIGLGCDVTSEAELAGALDRATERFGRIDILINNAGLQHVAPLEDFPTEKFEQMVKVMLVAPFMAIKRVFPGMKNRGFGRIINMASINGLVGFAGKAAYNSSKHGLIGLTRVAALEAAPHGITVNALCPGYVDTPLVRNQLADLARTRNVSLERVLEEVIYPLVPQRRLLSVKDVADYALFLASDRAGCVTGQAVVVDGGYTAQ